MAYNVEAVPVLVLSALEKRILTLLSISSISSPDPHHNIHVRDTEAIQIIHRIE